MHLQQRLRLWLPWHRRARANLPPMTPVTPDAAPAHRLYAFERRARRSDAQELTVQADSEEEAVRDLARQLRKARPARRR